MDVLRTPDERFDSLPDYAYAPHYVEIDGLRVHHVEAGPADAAPTLSLHGEPTWSFLCRRMIPIIAEAGQRVLAPDLVGFGRSDKPVRQEDYTYQRHVDWMTGWMEALDLRGITLVCQDWGSLIGLRLAAENPDRFARIVLANGGLPTGDQTLPPAFHAWREFARTVPVLPIGDILRRGCRSQLAESIVAGYEAPFPDESYKAGARVFPSLVPISPDDPSASANRRAWEVFSRWEKPFLTAFSDGDPITQGGERFVQQHIPGAAGQPHVTIKGAGHFLQEDKGVELAQAVVHFIAATS